eukprot:Selendium_serpulae@DN9475_c0_g1_i1.p1
MEKMGFQKVYDAEPCIFKKGSCIIVTYVDDILGTGPWEELQEAWREIQRAFEIEGMEEIKVFLGIRVTRREDGGYEMDQTELVEKIVQEAEGMATIRARRSPSGKAGTEFRTEAKLFDECCRHFIGMLGYVARGTRPDISFTVSKLGREVTKWSEESDGQMVQLLGYMKG